jgi:hypothetical protein
MACMDGLISPIPVRMVWLENEIKWFFGGLKNVKKLMSSTRFRDYMYGVFVEDWVCRDFKPFVLSPIWHLSHIVSK